MTTYQVEQGILTAASQQANACQAAAELADALQHEHLGFVLFFCSAEYDLAALADALESSFPTTPLSGCTTAGEITPGGYDRGSIVAIGFDRRLFAIETALIDDLEHFELANAQPLVDTLLEQCRQQTIAPINEHSFALTLLDGLSSREEQVLATLDAALGRIPSFGGSAGDDNHLSHTHVYTAGRFYTRAAVVVMINTRLPFEVFSTHHLIPLAHKLVVTEADREQRRVIELNGLPAAQVYAELVCSAPAQLNAGIFARHPLAVRIGGQHYVRSIQRVNSDSSLSFYCAVENGIVLTAMQPTPLLDNLSVMLAGVGARLGAPSMIIGCDCFLRRMELEALQQLDQASQLLRQAGVVGFNTYGEQHHGMHVNQTFTGVAFGSLPTNHKH
ncbi:nitric oxide-sensing protein NosP [Vreelandella titanicae]|uniref:nitric oxide-sensing protein NosP n=1 Tax=Vreelandella titanicae TaxID=664683 RepID=UPI0003463F1D|nr:nitric oxide-sensing protein NosP [Halomonas titanicae]MCE7519742.1 FIST C-terminal domain-containing protein [Halomonas titanicae]NVE91901.1 FIST C-terminal domain-containing protein [Halomonas titanicae]